jgi:hypothetical protein
MKASAPVMLITLLLALAGCAAATPHPLQTLRNDAANKLAVQCYARHEGERLVYGSGEVFSACRHWAHQQVRVRFPQ